MPAASHAFSIFSFNCRLVSWIAPLGRVGVAGVEVQHAVVGIDTEDQAGVAVAATDLELQMRVGRTAEAEGVRLDRAALADDPLPHRRFQDRVQRLVGIEVQEDAARAGMLASPAG